MKNLGIYIHIPFCLEKCRYCGFYSHGGASPGEQEEYIAKLIDDIEAYGRIYGKDYIVDTVFIGGGTPSILPSSFIADVLETLNRCFSLSSDVEITIESNPKTLTEEKLRTYLGCGINRLSIGLQSFDDDILRTLGRVHTAADFLENFRLARRCGFENINIDLMFAVPGHTMDIWEDTLGKAIALSPEHISFYSLQIEEDTPFYHMFCRGEIEQIPDELDRAMYHRGIALLREAGYQHYEISNCARPGYACRHNLKYWSMDEYLGIGSSASSYLRLGGSFGTRFAEAPLMEFHENDLADEAGEFVFTGLRKTAGISFADFEARFGRGFWEVFGDRREELAPFFAAGQLIEVRDTGDDGHGKENAGLRLSEAGIDISNAIMAVFV